MGYNTESQVGHGSDGGGRDDDLTGKPISRGGEELCMFVIITYRARNTLSIIALRPSSILYMHS